MVKPLHKRIEGRYEAIHLKTKVTAVEAMEDRAQGVDGKGAKGDFDDVYDRVLVAVGRRPNGKMIGLDAAGVTVDERGFVPVDKQCAQGAAYLRHRRRGRPADVAHKATHQGKVAAEVAAGENRAFDARVIPSVAYTDPEIAWVGLTENEAKAKGIKSGKGVFPWAASGRSLSLGRDEGLTKVLFDRPASG